MKKILVILTILFVMISCGSKKNNEINNNTVTINIAASPSSIDPQITTDIAGGTVDDLLIEGLAVKDENGASVPGLAKSWEVSEDGLVWTFYLRDGIVWSNGDPVTAQDFKAGWLRALNPETAAENAYLLYMIENAEAYNSGEGSADDVAIEVIDDKTLQVKLNTPTPYFDDLITFKAYMPLNEKFYNEVGDKYFTEPQYTNSTGAYVLTEWVHDSKLVFQKNEKYWNAENVKVDEIVLKMLAISEESFNAYKNGELDVTRVTFQQAREYAGKPELVSAEDGGVWYILFNINEKPLNNAKIRKAFNLAINTAELVNDVLENSEKQARTLTPTGVGIFGLEKDFSEEVTSNLPTFNPEEAKKLLAEGMAEEGITEIPELEMIFTDSGTTKSIAEYIQESLRVNLGVNIKVTAVTDRIARSKNRDYQIAIANWTGDFKDPVTYLDLFVTGNGSNRGDFSNARYDELSKIVKSTGNKEIRVPAMIEMEKIISEEIPVVVLFQRQKLYLVNPKVRGLGFVAIGGEYNFKNLEISK